MITNDIFGLRVCTNCIFVYACIDLSDEHLVEVLLAYQHKSHTNHVSLFAQLYCFRSRPCRPLIPCIFVNWRSYALRNSFVIITVSFRWMNFIRSVDYRRESFVRAEMHIALIVLIIFLNRSWCSFFATSAIADIACDEMCILCDSLFWTRRDWINYYLSVLRSHQTTTSHLRILRFRRTVCVCVCVCVGVEERGCDDCPLVKILAAKVFLSIRAPSRRSI